MKRALTTATLASTIVTMAILAPKSFSQNDGAFYGLPDDDETMLRSDLTVQSPIGKPSAEIQLQLDLASPALPQQFGLALSKPGSGIPTLTQKFLTPSGQWRWSVTNATTSAERLVMTLDSATNQLTFLNTSGGSDGYAPPLTISPSGIALALSGYPNVSITGTGITIGSGSSQVSLTSSGLYLAMGSNIILNSGSITAPRISAGSGTLSGNYTLAVGYYNGGSGTYSAAIGTANSVNGSSALAVGNSNQASGSAAFAGGYYSYASGANALAYGNLAISSGTNAIAFGQEVTASSFCEMNIGRFSIPASGNPNSWVLTDNLFVVGNGTSSYERSNALTIKKNGDTAIKTNLAVGTSLTVGSGTTATAASQAVVGKYNDTSVGGLFVVGMGSGTGATPRKNAIRVREDGTLLVREAGDLSMGGFKAGEQP